MQHPSGTPSVVHRAKLALVAAALAFAALPVAAQTTVRLMLSPNASTRGQLTEERKAQLESLAGTTLTLTGTTRTGALELTLAQPQDAAGVAAIAKRLREDRGVLWAEPADARAPARKIAAMSNERGSRLLVRLADGADADWPALAARFSASLGTTVTPQRQIGNVWVLSLEQPQSASRLAELAEALQNDAAVRYADPVLRKHPFAAPNDPLFGEQWGLSDAVSGVAVERAWSLASALPPTVVAVVDTGILPHPDLQGRVLAGYDFISDANNARDGDARDADPRDEGDWRDAGDCDGLPATRSVWHGTFIAGQIAANTDNGVGIAGLAPNAMILPVRVLGKCGGTDEDVLAGVLWAAGVPIVGVPANPNPAKVINLSLGGLGSCTQAIQDAIDQAMAQGAIVVAAAGNAGADATLFSPANCSGVITVGAHNRAGERTFYSNFGARIDVSAPAGDGGAGDTTLSTGNDGMTVPGASGYEEGVGTSFAAPYVSAVASMMLAKNALMTPGNLLSVLQGSSRGFPGGTTCAIGGICGAGILDIGVALASTSPSSASAPPGTIPVIEYYDATRDHYFMTADAAEAASIDFGGGALARTGNVFFAWSGPALAPASAVPVCRFDAQDALIGSWFYTPMASECQYVIANGGGAWALQSAAAFWVVPADAAGDCPDGMVAVYRFTNNRADFNQRFTTDLSSRRAMINRAWAIDGYAPNGAAFCSPV